MGAGWKPAVCDASKVQSIFAVCSSLQGLRQALIFATCRGFNLAGAVHCILVIASRPLGILLKFALQMLFLDSQGLRVGIFLETKNPFPSVSAVPAI